MLKYKYAKDESGKLIDINSLDETNKKKNKFICIGCENELIAKLGKIKTHHFAHKKVVSCSGETYLHLLGKQLFYDNFVECLKFQKPFFIELYQKRTCNHYEKDLGVKCKLDKKLIKFDLTNHFDKISIEKREGSFIPDLMLTNKSDKEKVFIEIAVTHFSSEAKLNSEYRIIEFEIETEDDFEPIKQKFLSIENPKIKFKNFKTKEIITSICNGNCKKKYFLSTLDKDGRFLLKQYNLNQIKNYLATAKDKIVKYQITQNKGYYYGLFKTRVATFAKENLYVRNCFICRYHGEKSSWRLEDPIGVPIYCRFLKIRCNSNEAVTCECFKVDSKYVDELCETNQQSEFETEGYYNQEKK